MESIRFFFWEMMKVVSLALLGLTGAKAISAIPLWGRKTGAAAASGDLERGRSSSPRRQQQNVAKIALYGILLLLVCLGARGIGTELAAELYFKASRDDLVQNHLPKAYENALRAVKLRSGQLKYWQMLSTCKFGLRQYDSMLADRPILESLQQGRLGEQDAMRLGFGYFFLAQYDQAAALARQLIHNNRFYAAPYVLLGMAYTAQKNFTCAERTFLEVLQIYPNQEGAVEGLAHVYFLMGQPARSIAVLSETAKFQFDPASRQRFAELKALYGQAAPPQTDSASDQIAHGRQ